MYTIIKGLVNNGKKIVGQFTSTLEHEVGALLNLLAMIISTERTIHSNGDFLRRRSFDPQCTVVCFLFGAGDTHDGSVVLGGEGSKGIGSTCFFLTTGENGQSHYQD